MSGLAVSVAIGHPSAQLSRHDIAGYDVSWPQCSGSSAHHMPAGRPSYLILGLTDGRGHTANPCLGSQLSWARTHGARTGAYLVASYPTRLQRRLARDGLYGDCGRSKRCRLRNEGAAQAADAIATMHAAGVNSPRIWIDVEFRHSYVWTHHNRANAAVIQGIVGGLEAADVPLGVYTTGYMWHAIVGSYTLDEPNWLPVGHGGPKQALAMCGTTATGGPTWLVQYTRSLDSDLTCPALDPVEGQHTALWKYRRTTLTLLSTGQAVRAVQRRLGQANTGQYGPLTALAVTNWQRTKGLEPTGEIHRVDWRAMGAYRSRGGHGFWLSKVAGQS
jgi:peptidoglycan hydrolase-like protein with peptidoglycan-binding domain